MRAVSSDSNAILQSSGSDFPSKTLDCSAHDNDLSIAEANDFNNEDLEGDTNALTSLANLARDVLDEKHARELKVMHVRGGRMGRFGWLVALPAIS